MLYQVTMDYEIAHPIHTSLSVGELVKVVTVDEVNDIAHCHLGAGNHLFHTAIDYELPLAILEPFEPVDMCKIEGFISAYYSGRYPHQRLGQAFVNAVLPPVVIPRLFYDENENRVKHNIYTYFAKK